MSEAPLGILPCSTSRNCEPLRWATDCARRVGRTGVGADPPMGIGDGARSPIPANRGPGRGPGLARWTPRIQRTGDTTTGVDSRRGSAGVRVRRGLPPNFEGGPRPGPRLRIQPCGRVLSSCTQQAAESCQNGPMHSPMRRHRPRRRVLSEDSGAQLSARASSSGAERWGYRLEVVVLASEFAYVTTKMNILIWFGQRKLLFCREFGLQKQLETNEFESAPRKSSHARVRRMALSAD